MLMVPAMARSVGARAPVFQEDFESDSRVEWVERGFPSVSRKNHFAISEDEQGNHYLRVESEESSSARGVYLSLSVDHCPHFSWRWRISHTISSADLTRKERDDAAARLYLVFDGPSLWNPFDKRILVYVWDEAGPTGRILPNPWLPDKERMLVLETAASPTEVWVDESVDLGRDFARAFPGESPGELEALAFIADTDNTRSRVSAGLDDLKIQCEPRAHAAP